MGGGEQHNGFETHIVEKERKKEEVRETKRQREKETERKSEILKLKERGKE